MSTMTSLIEYWTHFYARGYHDKNLNFFFFSWNIVLKIRCVSSCVEKLRDWRWWKKLNCRVWRVANDDKVHKWEQSNISRTGQSWQEEALYSEICVQRWLEGIQGKMRKSFRETHQKRCEGLHASMRGWISYWCYYYPNKATIWLIDSDQQHKNFINAMYNPLSEHDHKNKIKWIKWNYVRNERARRGSLNGGHCYTCV